MRLAYLLKKFPRLSETFVLGEILGQEALGADVVVFPRRPADDEPRHPSFDDLRARIRPVGDDGLNPWRELFSAEDAGAGLFEDMSRIVPSLLAASPERVPKLVSEALWVLRACREEGVGHLHVHFATESAIVAWIVRHLGGPSYSITAHAKDIYRSTVDPAFLSRLVGDSAFTVTVCDANVEHLAGLLEPRALERVRRLYNGIDLADFARTDDGRAEDVVLGVGRLVEKKGFDTLIRAVPALRAARPEARVRIAGQGDDEESLRRLARELGVQDAVDFLGPLDQGAIREEMARATVFCLPCRIGEDGNRDALPTVLLEALAAGLPAVSTPVTGIPEILAGGRAGRLVPSDDPAALAASLVELLADPAERRRLADLGRARAEEHFDRSSVARVLRAWFEEALVPAAAALDVDPCA